MAVWNDLKVYVGVVGDPGAGKSTFINSIRGLAPQAPGAAEVGLGHTTTKVTEYPHPARPDNLIFVDFPGVLLMKGTGQAHDFDIQQYLDKHGEKMEQCHVFLVFSSGRIQHNAVQIGMKAREMGKKVLFVRSKFDKDLADKQNDDPKYFDDKTEADLMEYLRQDYITVLKKVGWEGEVNLKDVFIISGRLKNVLEGSWDIPKLRRAMIEIRRTLKLEKTVVLNTCRDFFKESIKVSVRHAQLSNMAAGAKEPPEEGNGEINEEFQAKHMEAWNYLKVYVGVVGEPGAGKSTFINSIRGLKPKAPGAAYVGLGHTTTEVTEYPHPDRPDSLSFVDFPGVFLKKGSGDQRDFDIQHSGRIQHNAVQIGMKAREMGKKVLFVRSKFDTDLVDKQNDDPEYFDNKTEADLMEELRQDYIKVLKKVGWEGEVNPRDVFIISGLLKYVLMGSWDIPKLRNAVFDILSTIEQMIVKETTKEREDVYRSKMRVCLLQ
ncbi:Interferon-inducible GTPase (IIGP) [Branchiostoma belcheri]|nr:Interferon-inducible GTPase (IIGP) [Branchiostoma belcheri]